MIILFFIVMLILFFSPAILFHMWDIVDFIIDFTDEKIDKQKKKKKSKIQKNAETKMFKMMMTQINSSNTPVTDINYAAVWAADHNCMYLLELLIKEGAYAYDELFAMAVRKCNYELLNYLFSLNRISEQSVISMIKEINEILEENKEKSKKDNKLTKAQKNDYKAMKSYLYRKIN